MVVMVLRRSLTKILTLIKPTIHQKYVVFGKNRKLMLYMKLQNYFYGYIRALLLFYEILSKDIQEMNFLLNPYDP